MAEFFSGHSEHTLDAKGRVIVPAKYRSYFAEGAHLGIGSNHSLALWTNDEFERKATAMRALMESDEPGAEEEAQFWSAYIEDVSVDASTGRLLVPPYMREHAELTPGQPVRLVGAITHLAIWNPARFAERIEVKASKYTKDNA